MRRVLFVVVLLLLLFILAVLASSVMSSLRKTPTVDTVEVENFQLKVDEQDPYRGSPQAPITIIEFGSYTCESCARSSATLQQVLALYPTQIRLVWKDFPHDGEVARLAALAGRCAQLQGKFWPYHDRLFLELGNFTIDGLSQIAQDTGLDVEIFNRCLTTQQTVSLVDTSVAEGLDINIPSVPYFDVNNTLQIAGDISLARWIQIIDQQLQTQ